MQPPRRPHVPAAWPLLLVLVAAAASASPAQKDAGDGSTYWGSDNQLIQGYTDHKGRHYPRLPFFPYDDDHISNHIAQAPASLYDRLPSPPPQHRLYDMRTRQGWPAGREGVFRTHGHASVRIPFRGAHVHVSNEAPSRKMYWGTINSTVTPSEQAARRRVPAEKRSGSRGARPCVRCPGSRAVVANRGQRSVLVEQPELSPCPGSPVLPLTKMTLDWVHGPKPGSLAEEGDHTVLVRMLLRRRQIQKCRYRYSVIVRRCPELSLPNFLMANCTVDNIWGSICDFRCQPGHFLKGASRIECGDSLTWSHPFPECEAMSACPMPMSPEHGRLSCRTVGRSPPGTLPEHSVCRYECDEHYTVPDVEHGLTVIECRAGEWNSTADPSCLEMAEKKPIPAAQLKQGRHHKSRRRHRAHRSRVSVPRATAHAITADPCRPNPCQEGGTCLLGPPSAPAICLCPPHRQGEYCEREQCKDDMCQNGGKCLVFSNEAICFCPTGYSGAHCQIKDAR